MLRVRPHPVESPAAPRAAPVPARARTRAGARSSPAPTRCLGRALVALCTLLAAAPAAGAEIYRWVDEHGEVHYGDRPPAGGAEAIELAPGVVDPPGDPAAAQRRRRQQKVIDAFGKQRAEREAAREEARAEAEERQARCRKARERLAQASDARYLYVPAEDGARDVLSDEQRRRLTERMQQAVERWC